MFVVLCTDEDKEAEPSSKRQSGQVQEPVASSPKPEARRAESGGGILVIEPLSQPARGSWGAL